MIGLISSESLIKIYRIFVISQFYNCLISDFLIIARFLSVGRAAHSDLSNSGVIDRKNESEKKLGERLHPLAMSQNFIQTNLAPYVNFTSLVKVVTKNWNRYLKFTSISNACLQIAILNLQIIFVLFPDLQAELKIYLPIFKLVLLFLIYKRSNTLSQCCIT